MRRLFSLLTLAACLWMAPASRAEDARPLAGDAADAKADAGVRTRSLFVGDMDSPRPTPIEPVRGIHAEAIFPFEQVGVFAETHGFALSRTTALYHVQGGASIPLDDGVRLTASYRMLGMDFGLDSDVERADVEPGLAAPFLGLAFDF